MLSNNILKRLLRLRQLEEEQSGRVLETLVHERNRLEMAYRLTTEDRVKGRLYLVAGIEEQNGPKRLTGLAEVELATHRRSVVGSRLEIANAELAQARTVFLQHRAARRQMELLSEKSDLEAAAKDSLRAQQMLDDWYGRRQSSASRKGWQDKPTMGHLG